MPQDPFLVDQIQIEPGGTGTRTIRKAADNSIEFVDPLNLSGITVTQLAGLRSVSHVLVVGKSGAGAAYTTVQSALDAIPAGASAIDPYFVIVGPGVYKETINIVRDGVHLIGFGATLASLGEDTPDGVDAYHTIVIQEFLGTIPQTVSLRDFRIQNAHTTYACVRVVGGAGSTVGSGGIVLHNCELSASSSSGGRTLDATSMNKLHMRGGSMRDSHALGLLYVEDCAEFILEGVDGVPNLQLDYDSAGTLPSLATSAYRVFSCPDLGRGSLAPQLSSTLSGVGSLEVVACTGAPRVLLAGDMATRFQGSYVGTMTLNGTVSVKMLGSEHGVVTAAAGTSLEEPIQWGTEAFAGDTFKDVTFLVAQPDVKYVVVPEVDDQPVNDETVWITNKVATGFRISFATAQTLGVTWSANRNIGGVEN